MLLKYAWRATIGFIVLLLGLGVAYLLLRNNIHPVIPGQVYRSAQLTPTRLAELIKSKKIKSVINLRGANPERHWYEAELATTRRLGVRYYNVRMHAYRLPKPATLRKLVLVLQAAPRPLVIHCEGGADRTGLASAVVLLLNNKSFTKARSEVSAWYFAYSPKSVGRLVLPFYRRWLKQHGFHSTRQHFLEWVADVSFQKSPAKG